MPDFGNYHLQVGPKGEECLVCAYSSTNPDLLETEHWWMFSGNALRNGRAIGLITCLRMWQNTWTVEWCGMFKHRADIEKPWPDLPPSINSLDQWRDDGSLHQMPVWRQNRVNEGEIVPARASRP
jgi:hypothetical protein